MVQLRGKQALEAVSQHVPARGSGAVQNAGNATLEKSAGKEASGVQRFKRRYRRTAAARALMLSVWTLLAIIAAVAYRIKRTWPEVEPALEGKDLSQWSSGLFDCFGGGELDFFFVCLCPNVRWAENFTMVGISSSFWMVFGVLQLLFFCSGMAPFLWISAVAIGVHCRQTIRRQFKMEGHFECAACLGDCVIYCCCPCCAIAQEARHLDLAAQADHPAVRDHRPGAASAQGEEDV